MHNMMMCVFHNDDDVHPSQFYCLSHINEITTLRHTAIGQTFSDYPHPIAAFADDAPSQGSLHPAAGGSDKIGPVLLMMCWCNAGLSGVRNTCKQEFHSGVMRDSVVGGCQSWVYDCIHLTL